MDLSGRPRGSAGSRQPPDPTSGVDAIADALELLANGIKALAAGLRENAPPAIVPPAASERLDSPKQVLLTPKQLAAELNVAEQTLAKWRLSGTGPHYRKLGRSIRYDRADVAQWVKERRYAHTSAKKVGGAQ